MGIEPVNAAFDLGIHVSDFPNPINKKGVSTAMEFNAGKLWTTHYKISVSDL